MRLFGKLSPSGDLTNMSSREPQTWPDGSTDVPLAAMPSWFGPCTYDAVRQLPVQKFTQDQMDKNTAKSIVTSLSIEGRALRVMARLTLKGINELREWDTALKTAVAAATNLVDLKARIAALPAMSDYTMAQLQTTMATLIDAENDPNT